MEVSAWGYLYSKSKIRKRVYKRFQHDDFDVIVDNGYYWIERNASAQPISKEVLDFIDRQISKIGVKKLPPFDPVEFAKKAEYWRNQNGI